MGFSSFLGYSFVLSFGSSSSFVLASNLGSGFNVIGLSSLLDFDSILGSSSDFVLDFFFFFVCVCSV